MFGTPADSREILDPVQLGSEIERRISELQTRRRKGKTQALSQLAVLLYEAHRTSPPCSKGNGLAAYVRGLGWKRDRFEKYKTAGKALLRYRRDLFEAVLLAVRDGTPSPELPDVSKLAKLPSVLRQGGANDGTAELAIQKTTKMRTIDTFIREKSYGTDPAGRRTLQALDDFGVRMGTVEGVLQDIITNKAGVIPEAVMHRKVGALLRGVHAIAEMVAEIYDGTSSGEP